MRLGAKILKNVVDVNHWQHSNQAHLAEGQANEVYIQLVDLDWSTKASPEQSSAFPQYPIRYISGATAISVKAVFLDIDDDDLMRAAREAELNARPTGFRRLFIRMASALSFQLNVN